MTKTFRLNEISLAAMAAVISIGTTTPIWAQGSNTTSPAPTPATPPAVITSAPQLSAVGGGGCAQQYTNAINSLNQNSINADTAGLVSNGVAATSSVAVLGANIAGAVLDEVAQAAEAGTWAIGGAAMIVGGATVLGTPAGVVAGGVAMEAAAASSGVQAAATAVKIAGLTAETVGVAAGVAGVASQVVAQVHTQNSQNLAVYVATLPDCEGTHTGTLAVTDGGVNVTGESIFNDDVGVAGDVNVEGDVNASQVHATQGISAVGGGIWIGDPNGTTFSDGITIGGGAVSGAGFGGAQAFTGDANAMAIGNNAQALQSGSVALGLDASSTGTNATAVGNNAAANADDTTAVGTDTQANAAGSAAYGQGAVANLTQQQVFGTAANTYTTPGITSGLSRSRQSGPLDVATSDAAGNLATDGGLIFKTLSENQAGIAIAMSLPTPSLHASESFGVAFNWGKFKQSQAFGVSAMGVLNRNVFGGGERLSLNGAFGLSKNEKTFAGHSSGTAHGGRVGVQLSW